MRAFGILPMVPLEILPMVQLVANGTIGNQRTLNVSRQSMVPLVPMLPLVETLVPITGTIGRSNGTIGKPNGVNSSIMINTSNLFLYSYFFMCIFQYCYYFRIST